MSEDKATEKTHLLPPSNEDLSHSSYPGKRPYTEEAVSSRADAHNSHSSRHSLPGPYARLRLKSRSRHQSWTSDAGSLLLAKGFEDPIESSGSVEAEGGQKIALQKNLTLFHAVVFILVNVTGTGIFITPTGVTAGVGSVGATLLTWMLCGLYNLSLALCYAELGTAFPVAGGDYVYIQQTVGYLPAFMCLYIYVFMGPVAVAVASRTVGEYMLPIFGLQCNTAILILLAVFLNSKLHFIFHIYQSLCQQ